MNEQTATNGPASDSPNVVSSLSTPSRKETSAMDTENHEDDDDDMDEDMMPNKNEVLPAIIIPQFPSPPYQTTNTKHTPERAGPTNYSPPPPPSASKNVNLMWALPIILGDMTVAADHPGLMQLVESYMNEFGKKDYHHKSAVVQATIDHLLNKIKPVMFLEKDVKEMKGGRSVVTNQTKEVLHLEDVLPGGKYRNKLESKVRKCFMNLMDPNRKQRARRPAGAATSDPLMCNEEIEPVHQKQHYQHKTKIQFLRELNFAKNNPPPNLQIVEQPSSVAPKTPERFGNGPVVNDKTPLIANTTKKKRGPYLTKAKLQAKQKAAMAARLARFPKARHGKIKVKEPQVHVRDLTYDWSSLDLDGTAAWNQQSLSNSHITAVDLCYKMQALRDSLRTTAPPKHSPLYDCLRERGRPNFNAFEDLGVDNNVFFVRLASQFYDMITEETSEAAFLNLRRRYQFMTVDELKQRVLYMEQEKASSDLKEVRTRRAATELGLLQGGQKRPANAVVPPSRKKQRTAFWQPDFAELLTDKGPSQYLMEHDQY